MGETPPATEFDTRSRVAIPRDRVFVAGLLGLLGGFVMAAAGSGEPIVRWVLVPLGIASIGVMLGFLSAVRAVRREMGIPTAAPRPPAPILESTDPQPHALPSIRPERGPLALGPDPWSGRIQRDDEGETDELDEAFAEAVDASPYLSHDGARLLRPGDHELETARRAVARMVADLSPMPGAFDAVCERLIAVGQPMARRLGALGRETTDHEKVLGIDLFDRLVETRVTEAGLEVMKWVRWAFAALDEDHTRHDEEFFAPVSVAMASRYGGTSERWQSAIMEPLRHVELGGVVEQIALAVKASDRSASPATVRNALDQDAVDRMLEAPQWM